MQLTHSHNSKVEGQKECCLGIFEWVDGLLIVFIATDSIYVIEYHQPLIVFIQNFQTVNLSSTTADTIVLAVSVILQM